MTINDALALALLVAAFAVAMTRNGPRRQAALVFVAGIVAMRLAVYGLPHDWRYLASCAVWVAVGADAIRRGLIVPGALLIASGLCYVGQEVTRLAPVFGNPWLVAADLFGWLALLGVYRVRPVGISDPVGALDRNHSGRGILARDCGDTLAEKAAR